MCSSDLLHVLCEKPLSLSSAECTALHEEATRVGRLLGVNMVRRLFQSVEVTARALAYGWLGDLESVSIAHGGAYGWPIASLAPFLPVIGSHPVEPGLAMFNGLGSKGSLLAPKMAAMLAGHLLSGDAIPRDIDVRRRMAGERP